MSIIVSYKPYTVLWFYNVFFLAIFGPVDHDIHLFNFSFEDEGKNKNKKKTDSYTKHM